MCVYVREGVFPVCAYRICVSPHTLGIHNDIVRFILPGLEEVYQGNSGLSKLPFLQFLSLPLHPHPLSSLHLLPRSLSAGREIQMCRGTWTGKGEGERERERNPHPPGDRPHCPRPFGQAFRHKHTNNYAHQTIESL